MSQVSTSDFLMKSQCQSFNQVLVLTTSLVDIQLLRLR